MAPTAHKIVTIPRLDPELGALDETATALGHKYRDFRLLALRTSPGAFAASYEEEARRGLDHTFVRLSNPKATQFVALECHAERESFESTQADVGELTSSEWHGFIGIFGPLEDSIDQVSAVTDPFVQMTAGTKGTTLHQSPAARRVEASEPLRYHLNGMFVSPAARGLGLGKRLIDAALDGAEAKGKELSCGVRSTILLDEWNTPAKKLYEKAGFHVISRERYTKDAKRLAEGETAREERAALRMEVRRGC